MERKIKPEIKNAVANFDCHVKKATSVSDAQAAHMTSEDIESVYTLVKELRDCMSATLNSEGIRAWIDAAEAMYNDRAGKWGTSYIGCLREVAEKNPDLMELSIPTIHLAELVLEYRLRDKYGEYEVICADTVDLYHKGDFPSCESLWKPMTEEAARNNVLQTGVRSWDEKWRLEAEEEPGLPPVPSDLHWEVTRQMMENGRVVPIIAYGLLGSSNNRIYGPEHFYLRKKTNLKKCPICGSSILHGSGTPAPDRPDLLICDVCSENNEENLAAEF